MTNQLPNISENTKYRFNIGDYLALFLPMIQPLQLNIIGRLYIEEIFLLLLFPLLFSNRGKSLFTQWSRRILFLILLWLAGQILTDIIRSTPFTDWSRGWSNIIFFMIDYCSFYMLLSNNRKRLLLYATGWAIGLYLATRLQSDLMIDPSVAFKFAVAQPLMILYGVFCSIAPMNNIKWLAPILFFILAMLDIYMNARSSAGVAFLSSVYLFFSNIASSNKNHSYLFTFQKKFALSFAMLASIGILYVSYSYVASNGFLGKDAQAKFEEQDSGRYGILLGGRPEIIVSSQAIIDSPIIGHGSWAKDIKYTMMLFNLKALGYKLDEADMQTELESQLIPTHSHLMGAWVDAGILGAIFWFWILYLDGKTLLNLYLIPNDLRPLAVPLVIEFFWDILFSPFGADQRMIDAFMIILLMSIHNILTSHSCNETNARMSPEIVES